MTLRDRLRWSLRLTPARDPIAEFEASITAGCARRKIEREGRRAAALRGMGR
jgi:hypothetical protein